MVFRLGLTGSIGMGKSTTAAMFRARGVAVHDADAAVHRLYAGAAVPIVEAAFPGTVIGGIVDRVLLSARVVGDEAAMRRLEALVHPLVRQAEQAFLDSAARAGRSLVLLDIPLLFETGAEARCDAILVVSCEAEIQRQRVLGRSGMTEERFAAILGRQVPDADKRRRAHHVIDTGLGLAAAQNEVDALLRALAACSRGRQAGG